MEIRKTFDNVENYSKIFNKSEFIRYAKAKLADQPLNEQEKEILELITDLTQRNTKSANLEA